MRHLAAGLLLVAATLTGARGGAVVQTFTGTTTLTTPAFSAQDQWDLRWTGASSITLSVLRADGTVAAGATAAGDGSLYQPTGGTFHLQIAATPAAGAAAWQVTVVQVGGGAQTSTGLYEPPVPAAAPAGALPVAGPASSTNAAPLAPAGAVSPPAGPAADVQVRSVVLIKGDTSEGTGFLTHAPDGTPVVVTNLHVISDNPNLKITTTDGRDIPVLQYRGATDRDAAMMTIKDDHYAYLDLASDIDHLVHTGDAVLTPGNSEGGEVFLDTAGQVRALGPDKVEISNPIFHGNSGGPVLHVASGKVIGAVYMGSPVKPTDQLDAASLANPNSAITGSMRYFAVRLDNVPAWETYDWNRFLAETEFLHAFHRQTRMLDSFLNGAQYEKAHLPVTGGDEGFLPNAHLFLADDHIHQLALDYHDRSRDLDKSGQMDASRELLSDLADLASTGMTDIQQPQNFYQYDRLRTRQEIVYRQYIIDEINRIGDRIGDLGH